MKCAFLIRVHNRKINFWQFFSRKIIIFKKHKMCLKFFIFTLKKIHENKRGKIIFKIYKSVQNLKKRG